MNHGFNSRYPLINTRMLDIREFVQSFDWTPGRMTGRFSYPAPIIKFQLMNNILFKNKYRISSTRLQNWNYSWDGYYFVTICIKDRICCLGNVINGKMQSSEQGKIVEKYWRDLSNQYKNCKLDEFIVMPNHVHGIVVIDNNVETRRGASLRNRRTFGPLDKNSLSSIINHFKGNVKRWCNKNGSGSFQWQSRFYDHIIRNEKSLNNIREYIRDNPPKWELDRNNLANLYM